MKHPRIWHFCIAIFLILSITTFTPLVIPVNTAEPYLFGLPRTLWVGILISILMFATLLCSSWATASQDKESE